MTELKPCPFCGVPESDETVNFDHHKDDCYLKMTLNSLCKTVAHYAMEISRDGFVDERLYTPEQIHEAWNTRAEREVGISKFQKLTGVNYVTAKRTLSALNQVGLKVVE